MSKVSLALRPYWAYGLNNAPNTRSINFVQWIENGNDYIVNSQIERNKFSLVAYKRIDFLLPVAQDCNRFGIAAFESALIAEKTDLLPKSLSWVLIRTYYSAFYAGHFILRMLGCSLTQLNRESVNKVYQIAEIYNYANDIELEKGFYICDFGSRTPKVDFQKSQSGDEGSHAVMWKLLMEKFKLFSVDILRTDNSNEYQNISNKFGDFVNNLSHAGSNNGGWLSKIRNEINYKQLHSTWFPYTNYPKYYYDLRGNLDKWRFNPLDLELRNLEGKELLRFVRTCQFILGVAREMCVDMNFRASGVKSFHQLGALSFLRQQRIDIKL
jgi:hypothetical protein